MPRGPSAAAAAAAGLPCAGAATAVVAVGRGRRTARVLTASSTAPPRRGCCCCVMAAGWRWQLPPPPVARVAAEAAALLTAFTRLDGVHTSDQADDGVGGMSVDSASPPRPPALMPLTDLCYAKTADFVWASSVGSTNRFQCDGLGCVAVRCTSDVKWLRPWAVSRYDMSTGTLVCCESTGKPSETPRKKQQTENETNT